MMDCERRSKRQRREHHREPQGYLRNSLHLLVQNDWLSPVDLGRVGCVSSSLRTTARDNELWARLCQKRWPNTAKIPREVFQSKGYMWYFQQRSSLVFRRMMKDAEKPLPPPITSLDQLMVLVDISVDGVTRASEAITGEALIPLLEKGSMSVSLSTPVPLGDLQLTDDGFIGLPGNPVNGWKATVHLLRLSDQKWSCIHETSDAYWDDNSKYSYLNEPEGLRPENIDWNEVTSDANVFLASGAIQLPEKASALTSRIDGFHGFYAHLSADIPLPRSPRSLGHEHVLSLYERMVHNGHARSVHTFDAFVRDEWRNGLSNSELQRYYRDAENLLKESKKLFVSNFNLSFLMCDCSECASPFNSQTESKKHGVTLLHVIDSLFETDSAVRQSGGVQETCSHATSCHGCAH